VAGERVERDLELIESIAARPGLDIARALFEGGWPEAARAEWSQALAGVSGKALCQAGLLTQDWGWYGQGIIALARGGCRGDQEADYPLVFRDTLEHRAEELELSAAWTWGVMRAESLFLAEARSRVGALGLMQLMPATARDIARRTGEEFSDYAELLDPERNIRFGTYYLRQMLDRFDNHPALATAAYNAGPGRVDRWLPDRPLEADVWAETVPFQETRNYLRRVMTHTLGFDQRLGNGQASTHAWLREIGGCGRMAEAGTEATPGPCLSGNL
jgi:soluble lytic murein transglycosylase